MVTSLSDKRGRSTIMADTLGIEEEWWYPEKKLKEAVEELKTEIAEDELTYTDDLDRLYPIIDKIFGDKLI